MRSLTPSFLLLLAVAACGGGQPTELAAPSSRGDALTASNGHSLNGHSLNGHSLNGHSLNGHSLNGHSLNGVSLNGVSLNGHSLNGIALQGSQLISVTDKWTFIAGTQFAGASINGVLSDGSTLPMHIDDVSKGTGSNSDVWFYDVSYQSDEGWFPLCGTDAAGAPLAAIPLAGTWDYSEGTRTGGSWTSSTTTFTFACRLNALAKCVEMGYKPWASVNRTSLRDHHQACSRMIRADYCGNGLSWTLDGRLINLYDSLGIQTDTDRWTFEAEWKADGARCLTLPRVVDLRTVFGVVDQCVLEKVLNLGCGAKSHFSSGTLLMNEYRDLNVLGLLNL